VENCKEDDIDDGDENDGIYSLTSEPSLSSPSSFYDGADGENSTDNDTIVETAKRVATTTKLNNNNNNALLNTIYSPHRIHMQWTRKKTTNVRCGLLYRNCPKYDGIY